MVTKIEEKIYLKKNVQIYVLVVRKLILSKDINFVWSDKLYAAGNINTANT